MKLKHRININLVKADGSRQALLRGGERRIRERLLRFLLGPRIHVLVISPGDTVSSVSIHAADA